MKEFEEELLVAMMPSIYPDKIDIAKMAITMICHKYEIKRAKNELIIYEGDINEKILQRFLMSKIAKGCSERTVKYYKQTITWFFNSVSKPFNEVTAEDIRYYLAVRIQRDGVSKTSANNERRNLSSFYGFLQTEEILLKNPMLKVDPIKETKKKKKAFQPLDMEKLRFGCRTNRERVMIEFFASTWARVSEVAQVKLSDIDGVKVLVHGKGDKEREVYLNSRAQIALEMYLKERQDDNPYLFPRAKYTVNAASVYTKNKTHEEAAMWYADPELVSENSHIDKGTLESIIRKIGKRTGVTKVHPHRFRRTGATLALRAGMPLTTVSKLLGHRSIETTQIYLDIPDKELEQAHEKYVI